ncbi:MAG: tRNA dihydrouridine synthase DusB [Alphaproteobacteria bacterium]|nr:tRNA dihydrouridine synthase DusB [Alphaproteobacteria bacterium]
MTDPLCIGPIRLPSAVILAPMSGVTDLPFRRLVRRFGVGMTVCEMAASKAILQNVDEELRKLALDDVGEAPRAVQLAGCEPEALAEAARIVEGLGADLIDINMGCPAKKVTGSQQAGSALMRDLDHATALISATVKAVDVPVTVKMRTGWDDETRNAPELAHRAEGEGAQLVTVHGRTRCQFYTGSADWDFVAGVVDRISIPVVINGDITSVEKAVEAKTRSGAAGVMIGRGAYGRPWFPAQVAAYLADGTILPDPAPAERLAVMRAHWEAMLETHGRIQGLRVARKHVGWYTANLPNSAAFRQTVNNTMDEAVVRDAIARFEETLLATDRFAVAA